MARHTRDPLPRLARNPVVDRILSTVVFNFVIDLTLRLPLLSRC